MIRVRFDLLRAFERGFEQRQFLEAKEITKMAVQSLCTLSLNQTVRCVIHLNLNLDLSLLILVRYDRACELVSRGDPGRRVPCKNVRELLP